MSIKRYVGRKRVVSTTIKMLIAPASPITSLNPLMNLANWWLRQWTIDRLRRYADAFTYSVYVRAYVYSLSLFLSLCVCMCVRARACVWRVYRVFTWEYGEYPFLGYNGGTHTYPPTWRSRSNYSKQTWASSWIGNTSHYPAPCIHETDIYGI